MENGVVPLLVFSCVLALALRMECVWTHSWKWHGQWKGNEHNCENWVVVRAFWMENCIRDACSILDMCLLGPGIGGCFPLSCSRCLFVFFFFLSFLRSGRSNKRGLVGNKGFQLVFVCGFSFRVTTCLCSDLWPHSRLSGHH